MAFTLYFVTSIAFILVCLAILWPLNVASRRVEQQVRHLKWSSTRAASKPHLDSRNNKGSSWPEPS
jgi:hypothetical protein